MTSSHRSRSFVADTHALIWHMTDSPRLSPLAKAHFLEADRGEAIIYLSVISAIEMIYLTEKGRLPGELWQTAQRLLDRDLSETSYQIISVTWELTRFLERVPYRDVPELPDRLIAATALSLEVPLITRDRRLRDWKGIESIW